MSVDLTRDRAHTIGARLDRSPLCVMLDVDGTLAPIVATPEQANVPAETRRVLAQLTQCPDTMVVLVSGRAAADAWRVADAQGVWVIGNHGFEIREPAGRVTFDDRARGFDDAIGRAAEILYEEFQGVRGVIVENKRWTLSVHYRQVDSRDVPRIMQRTADVARELGLRVLEGKKIVEVRPPLEINKGTACVSFTQRFGLTATRGSVLYAGDDRTDEDAFRALRAAFPDAVTVRVAADDESGATSAAELVINTLPELRELLEWVADRRASAAR